MQSSVWGKSDPSCGGEPCFRHDFATASLLGSWRMVFNIGGTKYRLVADVRYDLGRVYIRHVLTHAEYTRRTRAGTL